MIVSTLCICSIRKIEIHTDIFSWRSAVVQRAVRMNDIARWICVIDVSGPWISVYFHKRFSFWVTVSDVGSQFWVTIATTYCLTVKRLKANWASAGSELNFQMSYGKCGTSTRTICINVYCFRVMWREHIECYIAAGSLNTLSLLSFAKSTILWR